VVAGIEREEIPHDRGGRAELPRSAPSVAREDLVVREDGEPRAGEDETAVQVAHLDRGVGVAEEFLEPLGLATVVAEDHPRVTEIAQTPELAAEEIELSAEGGLGARIQRDGAVERLPFPRRERRFDPAETAEAAERAGGFVEECLAGRKVRRPDARVLLEPLRFASRVLQFALDRPGLIEPDDRSRRQ